MNNLERLRIDKWLWAARFFKTRALACTAVEGGHVQLNGQRCKPARELKAGDELSIFSGEQRWVVHVLALNEQRRPAAEARLLYQETDDSQAARLAALEQRNLQAEPAAERQGRPTKKERRQLDRWR